MQRHLPVQVLCPDGLKRLLFWIRRFALQLKLANQTSWLVKKQTLNICHHAAMALNKIIVPIAPNDAM